MKSANRLALIVSLTLVASACFGAPSFAQKSEGAALNTRIAELYRAGKYSEAIPLAQRLLAIKEAATGPFHTDVAGALNNLALLYSSQGRDAEAEPLYKRSLAILEKVHGLDRPEIAPELNNLAALYEQRGRYADAEPLFKRSLLIREKALGRDHPDVGQSLNNLATLYERQGRHADAEPLFKRSLAIDERALGPDHPAVATLLNNLGQVYRSEGRAADAEPLIKRSLSIRERAFGPDHPDVGLSLNNLAALYRAEDRYPDALPLVERTVATGRAQPSVGLPVLFGAQRQQLISSGQALDDALNVVQRGAQSSAASAVNKLAVRLAAGNDPLAQLVRKDQDLATEAEALDKAIIAAVSKDPSQRDAAAEQRTRERLSAIVGERTALQKVFAAKFPEYAALSNPLPLAAKDIQPLLSGDEAMLVYAVVDKESYVFALTREGFDWRVIPLGADALSREVAAFRRGLDVSKLSDAGETSGNHALFDLGRANELYTTLLGPVETLVKDKHALLVVPSGALTALPFHLLVTERPAAAVPEKLDGYRDAAWLLKRHAVNVLPSVASLKALRAYVRKDQGAKPMIGFGDPLFNSGRDNNGDGPDARVAARGVAIGAYTEFWQGAGIDRVKLAQSLPQLPDTADELKAIGRSLGIAEGDIHLGAEASETTVKRAPLADYRIVYFATHGLVAGDVKGFAEPSLALSIPKQPTEFDDGLLTASEVAQLKLNADWVVLSACNTIAGDKPGAEALSGLARAFFYAGARALLVSHWAVASDAATRLATLTFDRLKSDQKIGRAEALRQAMLSYLNDASSPRNAYPAFWGPFALIGEGAAR